MIDSGGPIRALIKAKATDPNIFLFEIWSCLKAKEEDNKKKMFIVRI